MNIMNKLSSARGLALAACLAASTLLVVRLRKRQWCRHRTESGHDAAYRQQLHRTGTANGRRSTVQDQRVGQPGPEQPLRYVPQPEPDTALRPQRRHQPRVRRGEYGRQSERSGKLADGSEGARRTQLLAHQQRCVWRHHSVVHRSVGWWRARWRRQVDPVHGAAAARSGFQQELPGGCVADDVQDCRVRSVSARVLRGLSQRRRGCTAVAVLRERRHRRRVRSCAEEDGSRQSGELALRVAPRPGVPQLLERKSADGRTVRRTRRSCRRELPRWRTRFRRP